MLVLTRRKNEAIIIGDGDCKIRIVVIELRGDKMRLGIEAPRDIPVHREEVFDAIELAGGDLSNKKTKADYQGDRDSE